MASHSKIQHQLMLAVQNIQNGNLGLAKEILEKVQDEYNNYIKNKNIVLCADGVMIDKKLYWHSTKTQIQLKQA